MTDRKRDMWRWPLGHRPNDPKTAGVRRTLARRARRVERRAVGHEVDRELNEPEPEPDIWLDADVIMLEELDAEWRDWRDAHQPEPPELAPAAFNDHLPFRGREWFTD